MSGFFDFQNAVMADEALQGRLDDLIANPEFNDESLIAFAGELGFTVIQEELDSTVQALSDEALEGVSGGAYDALVLAGHGTETTLQIGGSQMFNKKYLNLVLGLEDAGRGSNVREHVRKNAERLKR